MNSKTVLVTGATGFIGSHVADMLLAKGYKVRCTVRKTSNLRWLEGKNIELIEATLYDKSALEKAVEGVDYVYHIAGLTFAKNYEEFLKGNRDGTRNLLEAVKAKSPNIKRFTFLSSQTVAGPASKLDAPISEDLIPHPLTSYGRSKKAAEDEVLKYLNDFPVTIIRAPAVFGPRDTAIFDVFKIVNMGFGTLIGLKKKYISLIYSEDLARGIIEATESDNTIGKTYFIASDKPYTWDYLIDNMKTALGRKNVIKIRLPHFVVLSAAWTSQLLGKLSSKPPVFNYEKGIDFIQDYWICSPKNAQNDFGFKEKYSAKEALDQTAKWYKEQGWLK